MFSLDGTLQDLFFQVKRVLTFNHYFSNKKINPGVTHKKAGDTEFHLRPKDSMININATKLA